MASATRTNDHQIIARERVWRFRYASTSAWSTKGQNLGLHDTPRHSRRKLGNRRSGSSNLSGRVVMRPVFAGCSRIGGRVGGVGQLGCERKSAHGHARIVETAGIEPASAIACEWLLRA